MQKSFTFLLLGALAFAALFVMQNQPAAVKPQSDDIFENSVESYFERWALKYGKTYESEDLKQYRLMVFAQNMELIAAHNAQNTATHVLGENQFADLTNEEWRQTYLGFRSPLPVNEEIQTILPKAGSSNNITWIGSGALGQVLNQGQCGSCWAFSTVENLQAVNFLNGNPFVYYSEQQLVDCSWAQGNYGCNGGLMTQGFEYVISKGIESSANYPYTAVDGLCKYNAAQATQVISDYTVIPAGNCQALVDALQTQPIAIAVDAQTWQFYRKGILGNCGTTLDHGVQLVGYVDVEGSTGYWTVKNSWASTWGEQGYIQLALGNTCGLCNQASTGNLASARL